MGTRLIRPFYYKYFKNRDDVFRKCKECVNYSAGKCKLYKFEKLKSAREYFCKGWYFILRK